MNSHFCPVTGPVAPIPTHVRYGHYYFMRRDGFLAIYDYSSIAVLFLGGIFEEGSAGPRRLIFHEHFI